MLPTIVPYGGNSIEANIFGQSQKDQVGYFNKNFKSQTKNKLEQMTN